MIRSDWKNSTDQTYSCPRDSRHQEDQSRAPSNPSDHHNIIRMTGLRRVSNEASLGRDWDATEGFLGVPKIRPPLC